MVKATLSRPDGSEVLAVNASGDTFGEGAVAAIADTTGRYTLVLRRPAATEPSGRYILTVDALRARDADRTRSGSRRNGVRTRIHRSKLVRPPSRKPSQNSTPHWRGSRRSRTGAAN